MNFKLVEPGFVMQTGGLDDLMNIPMGPGRSFGSNYELEMMRRGSITGRLREHILHAGLEMSDNEPFSIRSEKIIPRERFQINPTPDDSIVDFNFGNRPIAGLEEPLALTKVHLNNINKEKPKPGTFILRYNTIGGKRNGKTHSRPSVGTVRFWYPVRTTLCQAILACT